MTAADNDWRLRGQERYLKGATLSFRPYRKPRPDWDHDHCEFCSAKFMEQAPSGDLAEGYATPGEKHWICPACFEDFKDRFAWKVVSEGEASILRASQPSRASQEVTELDLCRALLTREHLGVPERRALPRGRARLSILTAVVSDALGIHGWFPHRIDLDAQHPFAVLESRDGRIYLHERFEASAYGHVSPLRSRRFADAAEATRAYLLCRGDPLSSGQSIDGVPVDWKS